MQALPAGGHSIFLLNPILFFFCFVSFILYRTNNIIFIGYNEQLRCLNHKEEMKKNNLKK